MLLDEPLKLESLHEIKCPFSGLIIPKVPEKNLKWRQELLAQAHKHKTYQKWLRAACSKSPIFWLNAFGWTFIQRDVDEEGLTTSTIDQRSDIPFITWDVQDQALVDLYDSIVYSKDILINKSRDMGASWLCVAIFQWFWQFRPGTDFLELSRKESLVDKRGSMKSLFEKHRYLLKFQPSWLRPRRIQDNVLLLRNLDNGSTITGESTQGDAGQGDRVTAVLLDEFARVKEDQEIDLALSDTSVCKIYNSTPSKRPNCVFSMVYRTKRCKILELPWFKHPDKGRNAEWVDDPSDSVGYIHPPNKKVSSPWYRAQCERRSRIDIAQNIDMAHGESGDLFFDSKEINSYKNQFIALPKYTGSIVYTDEDINDKQKLRILQNRDSKKVQFSRMGNVKPWKFWVEFEDGRLSQKYDYLISADIANGTGSSNSVADIYCYQTQRIVGKFCDNYTSPEAFAEIVCMAATWIGGATTDPLIIWESNGPGSIFTKKLGKYNYTNLFFGSDDLQKGAKRSKKYGWHSSPIKKEMILGLYRDALKAYTFINPSEEALNETLGYVYDDRGRLIYANVANEENAESHGDHVIADALANYAASLSPTVRKRVIIAPKNSFAYRKALHKRRQSSNQPWAD